ncbi:hypothetical protein [Polyangium jinanense]|uniref:Lipoprotein n=1 Tax=Polyangium jinanense TaxID=2829994 RepID=A0A9X4AYD2_9BACT|nr:hypothetical protein [Polyangium jinanense]MDC3962885.1 hypothetical protein [Polyangium jinanense]MDC3988641.1 hypothetical protein [Polyangium jinanense]
MKKHTFAVALAALVFGAALGCSNTTPPPVDSGAASDQKAAPAPSCPAGTFANNEGQCLKECATDADCEPNQACEDVRFIEKDGSMGPLMGKGCQGP